MAVPVERHPGIGALRRVTAADQVSLTAAAGKITGLIGPNGAGKTTVFNACSGWSTRLGHVLLNQRSLGRLGPPARARKG